METRRILQIVLGVVAVAIVGLGGVIAYQLTREAPTVVDQSVASVDESESVDQKNPWEGKGEEAIGLVKRASVGELDDSTRELLELEDREDEEVELTVQDLVESEDFVKEKLSRDPGEAVGWRSVWWGETKHGASYYRVMYAFDSGLVEVGPTWVVDLDGEQVEPKNVSAQVLSRPAEGVESEYFGKFQEVVSAMSKHTFDSGLSLAGAVLLYFERRSKDSDDTIVGWSIQHERGPMYRAYFQWKTEEGDNYAEYEFDYDRKALKPVNLQAANIMKTGEQFQEAERVSILPKTYDPKGARVASRWTGGARRLYRRRPKKRPIFRALDMVLNDADRIDAIEWLLTAQAKTAQEFERCKEKQNCRWKTKRQDEGHFKVTYIYDLGGEEGADDDEEADGEGGGGAENGDSGGGEEGEQSSDSQKGDEEEVEGKTIGWLVYPDEDKVEPDSRISKLAHRVIRAR